VPAGAPLTRPGGFGAAAPSTDPGLVAPISDEPTGLIPGFAEGPPQATGPSEVPRRYWWSVGGALALAIAVLIVIVLLAASRIGHRGTANATPAATGALTPTSQVGSSGAVHSSGKASSSGSTTPANHQRGLAQATTIAGYLTRSGQARQGIGAAISAISGCTNVASAVTTLHNAAEVRAGIVTALANPDVSALPNGTAAVADLRRAMQASANADRHYAAWGQAMTGCHGQARHNADFAAAQQSDTVATAAKERFAGEWNPIAATYGLSSQNADTI
jgi:hypothetical protein